jgi:choice-of-anchor C domain-containing protein
MHRFLHSLLCIGITLLCFVSSLQAQNLLINGGFETPWIEGSWQTFYAGIDLGGWHVDHNSIDLIHDYWPSAEGNQSIDLSGQDLNGAIYQDVQTTPGQRYDLSFSFAGNPAFPESSLVKSMSVFWGPSSGPLTEVGIFTFDVSGHTLADLGWVTKEMIALEATATTMRLRFVSNTAIGVGPTLDNVILQVTQPRATVSGRVTLQNAVNQAQTLLFEFRAVDNGAPLQRMVTLNPNRTYTISDLPRKSYTVWIKGEKWLAETLSVDTTNGNVSNANVTLRGGDANNDNSVDVLDLDRLIQAFDSDPSASNWNTGADFNCDEWVDVLDLDLIIHNFDQTGAP